MLTLYHTKTSWTLFNENDAKYCIADGLLQIAWWQFQLDAYSVCFVS